MASRVAMMADVVRGVTTKGGGEVDEDVIEEV